MTRKFLTAIAAAAGVALAATSANATVFAGHWELSQLDTADPGLVLNTWTFPGGPDFSVDLGAQDPDYVDLFKLYTDETHINADDTATSAIQLKFFFDTPANNDGPVVVDGGTKGYTFLGIFQGGVLTWANGGQGLLTWGNGEPGLIEPGRMTLTVNGGKFNEGIFGVHEGKKHGLVVTAKFDWDNDPVFGAVPEPATWALMIGGFGMAGGALRRRRALATA